MKLSKAMSDVCKFIETAFDRQTDPDDAHWEVCKQTADQFDLWEETEAEGVQGFPLWLSFVVQGIGRDKGVLQ